MGFGKFLVLDFPREIMFIIHTFVRIYIYVVYSWPNGWTDWAEFFVDNQGWPWSVIGYKKNLIFFYIFFSRATPGSLASFLYY